MLDSKLQTSSVKKSLGRVRRFALLSCGAFGALIVIALAECAALWMAGVDYAPKSAVRHVSVGEFAVSPDGELGVTRAMVIRRSAAAKAEFDLILHDLRENRTTPLHLQAIAPRYAGLSWAGAALVVGCADGSVYLSSVSPGEVINCSIENGSLRRVHQTCDRTMTKLAVSPNAEFAAAAGGQFVDLLRLPQGQVLTRWRREFQLPCVLAFSGDSQWLLTFCGGNSASLWNLKDGKETATVPVERHECVLHEAALSHDGQSAVLVSSDGVVRVWSIPASMELTRWRLTSFIHRPLALSPEGRHLAVTKFKRGVYVTNLYETFSGERLMQLNGPQGKLTGLTFGPDDKLYAWDANSIHQWTVDSQTEPPRSPTREWFAPDIIQARSTASGT